MPHPNDTIPPDKTTVTTTTTTQQPTNRRDILWRDFAFLILVGVALRIISYVEIHAADSERVFSSSSSSSSSSLSSSSSATGQIVDAGFVITAPLNEFLASHPDVNDFLAMLNSLILVPPLVYAAYITLWIGDYTLPFRLLATQLFRSFCGWFTYLPPDPTFLMSVYDFPEIFQCLLGTSDCANQKPAVLPFVSFFSGHVATTVIIANHMFARNYKGSSVALHVFNTFQMLRLLATRGHYSIDIIIGWCVAVYISNPAGRLGLSYSRGVLLRELLVPKTGMDAFETVTGVADLMKENGEELVQTETTARIAAQMASEFAVRNLSELRKEVETRGIKIKEIQSLRRNDLIRLLSWAQLKVGELKAEARLLEVHLTEGIQNDKKKIIELMWSKARQILGEEGVEWLTKFSEADDSGQIIADDKEEDERKKDK